MADMHRHIELVKASIAQARDISNVEVLADEMLDRFFAIYPETKEIFELFDSKKVRITKFSKVGEALIDVVEYPDYSARALNEEVYRHRTYNIQDREYYFVMAQVFIETIKSALKESWTDEHEEVWHDTLEGLKHNVNLAATEHL